MPISKLARVLGVLQCNAYLVRFISSRRDGWLNAVVPSKNEVAGARERECRNPLLVVLAAERDGALSALSSTAQRHTCVGVRAVSGFHHTKAFPRYTNNCSRLFSL